MIIERIHIDSFGLFRDADFAFSRGMNVIEGPNESGKSTLAAFIRFMLYGFTGSDDGKLPEREHRVNWETGSAGGSMDVTVGEKRYRIFRLSERTEEGRFREMSRITDLESGETCGARAAAGEWFFGASEAAFRETAMTGQLASGVAGGTVESAVENILFSGNEKVSTLRAVRVLDEARSSLLHKSGRGGVLYELQKQQSDLTERIEDANRIKDDLLTKEALLRDSIARKEEATREEAKFTKLESDYRNTMVILNYDRLHGEEEKQKQVQDAAEEYRAHHRYGDFFPDYDYLTELAVARRGKRDAFDARTEAGRRVEELEAEVERPSLAEQQIPAVDHAGGEDAVRNHYRTARRRGLSKILVSSALLLACVTLLSLGLFLFLPRELHIAMILALGFGAIAGLFGAYFLPVGIRELRASSALAEEYGATGYYSLDAALDRVTEARRQIVLRGERISRAREDLASSAERYDNACRELKALTEKWGRALPEEDEDEVLDELVRDATDVITELSRLRAQNASLEATIRELRRELGDRNEVSVRGTVAPSDRERLVNLNHKDLLSGISQCHKQVKFYEEKQRELEEQLRESRVRVADPAGLAEKSNELDMRIAEERRLHDAYDLAMAAIAGASENLHREISPRLTEYANLLFGDATNGKYAFSKVDERMEVRIADGTGIHPLAYYSAGTQDLAYLSLRMALVDLLYRECPPLLFDETMCRQDDERAGGIARIFRRLTEEGRQCLFFTCLGRDIRLCEETLPVCRLSLGSAGEAANP